MTPVGRNTLLSFAAVWINPVVNTIVPLPGNRLDYRGIPSQGCYVVDIRGRIVSNAGTIRKLLPGIYYSVTPNGVMRRMVVGNY
jgi:hypothetical protein